MCDCYLVMVERLVNLYEPKSYAGGRSISTGRVTHARKGDGQSPHQKLSPRPQDHEVGLWANPSLLQKLNYGNRAFIMTV